MTTYNTGNPLGSAAAKDLYDNAENFDHLSNDRENETWTDRFGVPRLTWHGIEKMNEGAMSGYGWIPVGTFQAGATLTIPNQILKDETDGEYYRWDGSFTPSGKVVPAGSTPSTSGGVGVGAWISVGDSTLRSLLLSTDGADNIGTKSGGTVQDVLDKVATEMFSSFATVVSSTIKANEVTVNFKNGSVDYLKTGNTGTPSSGDAYVFYDASGNEYKIKIEQKSKNSAGVISFTEIWASENLDPTIFDKAKDLGISTFVAYTWKGNAYSYHEHFLDLCQLYGIDVILQAVPNQQYTADLDADFSWLSPLFTHPAVIGLYLLDEPDLTVYPLTRQGQIIDKARTLSSLPFYAATNAEANEETLPLHMNFDYIFTSDYAHFIGPLGIRRYASTTWASLEEEGMRQGRVIPLLTAYWYENEVPTLNTSQIRAVNDYLAKNYRRVGMWSYYGNRDVDDGYHFIENDTNIYDLVKASLALRLPPIKATKMIRTLFRFGNSLPANCYKFYTKPTMVADIPWLNPASSTTWEPNAGVLRIQSGQQFAINFGHPVRLEIITAIFNDNNGTGNVATLGVIFNPTIGSGRQHTATVTLTGGGTAQWAFTSDAIPPHLVSTVSIKVLSSTGPDYLILERIGFVYSE